MNIPNAKSSTPDDINESYGIITGPQTLRMERLLPGPIENVWSYLTETDKLGQWLAPGEMDLRPDGKVDLTFNVSKLTPYDEITPAEFKDEECGKLQGSIIACVPQKVLHFTWGSSEVKFEIKTEGDKVRLTLTHGKLSSRNQMVLVAAGWHTHIHLLIKKLEGKTPARFWPRFLELKSQYETMIRE